MENFDLKLIALSGNLKRTCAHALAAVLFGKKIPNKVAEKFANRVKVYRAYP